MALVPFLITINECSRGVKEASYKMYIRPMVECEHADQHQ